MKRKKPQNETPPRIREIRTKRVPNKVLEHVRGGYHCYLWGNLPIRDD